MDRRTTLKLLLAIPFVSRSLPFVSTSLACEAPETWTVLFSRNLRPNSRAISFDLREVRGIARLGIELRGNAIWLYDLKLAGLHVPVNLNVPPSREGCQPRLAAWSVGEHAQTLALNFQCLPLSTEPTKLLLWGSA